MSLLITWHNEHYGCLCLGFLLSLVAADKTEKKRPEKCPAFVGALLSAIAFALHPQHLIVLAAHSTVLGRPTEIKYFFSCSVINSSKEDPNPAARGGLKVPLLSFTSEPPSREMVAFIFPAVKYLPVLCSSRHWQHKCSPFIYQD